MLALFPMSMVAHVLSSMNGEIEFSSVVICMLPSVLIIVIHPKNVDFTRTSSFVVMMLPVVV